MRTDVSAVDIIDKNGPGEGAVTLPQLITIRAIIGAEEQRTVHVRQRPRIRTSASTANIFDECSPGGGAVTLPKFSPICAVIGAKEQRPVQYFLS